MHPVESRIGPWVVRALVGSAALLARQAAGGDEPGERKGVAQQRGQARGFTSQSGLTPEGVASLVGGWSSLVAVARLGTG